jgi:hypothetical protein
MDQDRIRQACDLRGTINYKLRPTADYAFPRIALGPILAPRQEEVSTTEGLGLCALGREAGPRSAMPAGDRSQQRRATGWGVVCP